MESRGSPLTPRSEAAESRLEALLADYGAILKRAIASLAPARMGIQVDDVEQEARIRVWRALEREKTIEDPASYLYRVAVTATIDAIRRVRARHEEQPAEGVGARESFAPTDPSPSPERRAQAREIAAAVQRATSRLAKDRREAVLLLLQDLNTVEIAGVLGCSEGRARNLAYRGLADLRRELKTEGVTLGR